MIKLRNIRPMGALNQQQEFVWVFYSPDYVEKNFRAANGPAGLLTMRVEDRDAYRVAVEKQGYIMPGSEVEIYGKHYAQQFVETMDEVMTLLARFKQAEFDAQNSRSVEYKLAQMEHGLRDFPAHDFPASVEIDDQGCAQINYGA